MAHHNKKGKVHTSHHHRHQQCPLPTCSMHLCDALAMEAFLRSQLCTTVQYPQLCTAAERVPGSVHALECPHAHSGGWHRLLQWHSQSQPCAGKPSSHLGTSLIPLVCACRHRGIIDPCLPDARSRSKSMKIIRMSCQNNQKSHTMVQWQE